MIVCEKCGRENEDRYKFCLGCGAPLEAQEPASDPSGSAAQKLQAIETAAETVADDFPSQIAEARGTGTSLGAPPSKVSAGSNPSITPPQTPADAQVEQEAPDQAAASDRECGNCGNPVPPDFIFCGKCGTRYEEPEPEPEPAEEPDTGETQMTSPVRGRLVLIHPDGTEGEAIGLMDGENMLGRASNVTALAEDEYLSPEHLKVTCSDGNVLVEDVGSLNGSFVRLGSEPHVLQHNDMVRIGQELLRYSTPEQQSPILISDEEETTVQGSPESEHWGLLHLVIGPNIESNVYVLDGDEQIVGREVGNILFRDDGFVSGEHARLTPSGSGGAQIRDLDSSNGTYVRLREPYQAQDGDFLLLGQQLFHLTVM